MRASVHFIVRVLPWAALVGIPANAGEIRLDDRVFRVSDGFEVDLSHLTVVGRCQACASTA